MFEISGESSISLIVSRMEIDGILRDGVLVSHTEGRIIEARVSHRKSS